MGARARRRRPGGRSSGPRSRKRSRFTRALLLAVAAFGAFLLLRALFMSGGPKEVVQERTPPVDRPPARRAARPAVTAAHRAGSSPRADDKLTRGPAAALAEPQAPPPPRAAIVIDDLGQTLAPLRQLAELDLPLSVAILPGLDATGSTVREAGRLKLETILHLPMEPREEGGKNPGPGALLTRMNPEEIRSLLREDLASVPGAVGVNNHMGSRFTTDAAALAPVMEELRGRGLFWLDSRTTPETRGAEVARAHGVSAAERDLFIDAEVQPDFIRRQLRQLIEVARRRGAAIGIGHPHAETLAVLREMRGELLASGVTWVPVSALVPAAPLPETVDLPPAPAVGHAAAKR